MTLDSERVRAALALALSGVGLAVLAGCTGGTAAAPAPAAPTAAAPVTGDLPLDGALNGGTGLVGIPFPLSAWQRPLPGDVPLDARSAAMAKDLAAQVAQNRKQYGYHVTLNTTSYAPPVYRPGAAVAGVRVVGTSCQHKSAARMQQWSDLLGPVPIPVGARPSAGHDGQLVVWQQSTDTVWELWHAQQAADGSWSACWGGKLEHASLSQGVFDAPYGTAASGLSELGGLLTPDEVKAGVISHALSVAIPSAASKPVSPANRTDGHGPVATQLAEGSRFRLPPDYPVTGTPVQQALVTALKNYGAVVTDQAGSVAFMAENTVAETGANEWTAVLGMPPHTLFDDIDWSQIQVVDPSWDSGTAVEVPAPTPPSVAVPSLPAAPMAVLTPALPALPSLPDALRSPLVPAVPLPVVGTLKP